MSMYHDGMRELQDRYGGRKVADRIEQRRRHTTFTDDDKAFIESAPFFFLATTWKDSVDCSIKGGIPGFVRVTASNELSWPDYDGNRMYRSLGNILRNANVGVLIVKFDAQSTRLRINGRARIIEDEEEYAHLPGATRLIRVTADHIYYNCPRSVPKMEFVEASIYSPRPGYTPPEPEWKSRDYLREVLDD